MIKADGHMTVLINMSKREIKYTVWVDAEVMEADRDLL